MNKKKGKNQSVGKPRKTGKTPTNRTINVVSSVDAVNDNHRAFIDEYFVNGFNRVDAMLSVNDDLNQHTAEVMASAILTNERNQAYLQQKRSMLRASTDIRNENVLRELINWAFVDATKFMTLTESEIQDLPPDIRRCIQSFKSYEKTSIDRKGTVHTTKTLEIKLVDKKTAMESIAKHIGFFLIDNEQKRTKINLNKVDVNILNGFLEAVEYQDMDS